MRTSEYSEADLSVPLLIQKYDRFKSKNIHTVNG
jgi:hypothetical protein